MPPEPPHSPEDPQPPVSAPVEEEPAAKLSEHPGVDAKMRRFGKAKLDHPKLLGAIFAPLLEDWRARTIEHEAQWRLDEAAWAMDHAAGKFSFTWDDGCVATADLQIIGLLKPDGNWLWSWTIANIARPLQEHVMQLWRSGRKEDLEWVFSGRPDVSATVRLWGAAALAERIVTENFPATEEEAWGFAVLAGQLCQAQGICRVGVGPDNRSLLFVTINQIQVTQRAPAKARAKARSVRQPPATPAESGEPRGGLIEGIEAYYEQIAAGLRKEAHVDIRSASCEASFFPTGGSSYSGEYVPAAGGRSQYMNRFSNNDDIIGKMRAQFRAEGKPLWGRCRFHLEESGKLRAWWGYENCDADGAFVGDAEETERMKYARHKRLSQPPWERYLVTGPSSLER